MRIDEILGFATSRPKKHTVKRRPPEPEEELPPGDPGDVEGADVQVTSRGPLPLVASSTS